MATAYEVQNQARNKPWFAAGFEFPALKSVTSTTTLAPSDSRLIGADTTAAAFQLNLPADPYDGMEFVIFDSAAAGSWNTNNLTLSGNGNSIVIAGAAAAASLTLSSRSAALTVRYYSTSDRWHVLSKTY